MKRAGYKLQFRTSDAVSTRMYRSFGQMWEGWTKNLALLFPHPLWLAAKRSLEFLFIVVGLVGIAVAIEDHHATGIGINGIVVLILAILFFRRIRGAHFDSLSNLLALFGLPLIAILLLNSYISHKSGKVRWKGRVYRPN